MRDATCVLLLSIGLSAGVLMWAADSAQEDQLEHYRYALLQLNNDMQINYQLQRETSAKLAKCESRL